MKHCYRAAATQLVVTSLLYGSFISLQSKARTKHSVATNEQKLHQVLDAQLTADERAKGVMYVLSGHVPAGTTLDFPHSPIHVPWEADLAFIDSEPMANWGHKCRYILINRSTEEVHSIDARFPPFRNDGRHWRVVFQAKSVPDSVLAVPK